MIHVHIKNQSFTIVPMKTQIGIKHKAPPMALPISLKLVTLTDVYFSVHKIHSLLKSVFQHKQMKMQLLLPHISESDTD